jgi:curved DNA-binding protein CbpA
MNYYELLAVKKEATEAEIRTAYRRLVQDHHPDHSGDVDAVEFRKVQQAYETLSDPETRAAYNQTLESEIPVRVVSSPISTTVYEVHRPARAPQWKVQEVRRHHRYGRSVWEQLDQLFDEFFDF